ncbi:DUF397 domain-containing protein [Streptomyces sp. Ru71]|uniref:DUF397 domain-containing protein n=1 Tax=Streptomyces sp. Ru71 TaxID=2080746 RepID=UPI000CDE1F6F|nr:DUF397 domain-containing protein [Streptomyces sp. Ru71]POX57112.1 DUF397 domain-containing protein [Streptomyces sp. Ru71]
MKHSEYRIPDASVLTGWRKSSYSGGSSGDCLEVTAWRKSSYSGGSSGNCLEVDDNARPTHVPVRDSKAPTGPALVFSASAWSAFVASLR